MVLLSLATLNGLFLPYLFARKTGGGYRKSNAVTRKFPFYMPTIEEVIGKLGKARYFSKVDLTKGFHQIPISQESMDKTSFGKFRYHQLPFGLTNAPAAFQVMTSRCLLSLSHCATPCTDDIIIFSDAWCGHKEWLISITLFLQSQIMCLLLFPLWMMYFASLVMPLLGVWGCGVVYCVHEGMGRRCRWPTTAGRLVHEKRSTPQANLSSFPAR